jgi:hypothetical protein
MFRVRNDGLCQLYETCFSPDSEAFDNKDSKIIVHSAITLENIRREIVNK